MLMIDSLKRMKVLALGLLLWGLGPEMISGHTFARSNVTYSTAEVEELLTYWRSSISISAPKFEDLTTILHEMQNVFPGVVKIESIGHSVQGRDLWVIKMSMGIRKRRKLLKPMVKHVANIHGNEALGRALLLLFAVDLLWNYKADKLLPTSAPLRPRAVNILNNIELHIVPSANPDGFEMASNEDCGNSPDKADLYKTGGVGRTNAKNVDLNRDFPDPFYTPRDDYTEVFSTKRQPETLFIMHWIVTHPFVLSTNFHGGALVATYGYDAVPPAIKEISSYNKELIPSITPDDKILMQLAHLYSSSHRAMIPQPGTPGTCPEHPFFENGITNGAAWYDVRGSMQDFNYVWSNCIDITIEASCCKFPLDSSLEEEWENNKESLYKFTEAVLQWGIKGIVTNEQGEPIIAAKLRVVGNDKTVLTTIRGEYWRMLVVEGEKDNYTVYAESDGCKSVNQTIRLNSTEVKIVNFTIPNCYSLGDKIGQNNLFLTMILLPSLLLLTEKLQEFFCNNYFTL